MAADERTALPPDPEHERFRGPAASRRERPLAPGISWGVGLAVGALLVAVAFAGGRSFRDLGKARARAAELSSQIEEAEVRIDELERRIGLLRDDPVTLERLAREELGLVRPGDLVVVLPNAAEPASADRASADVEP